MKIGRGLRIWFFCLISRRAAIKKHCHELHQLRSVKELYEALIGDIFSLETWLRTHVCLSKKMNLY